MSGKDNFFKARMTDEQAQTLGNIVNEIQTDTPEANVTASSIARYALEKYIDDYRANKDGKAVLAKISIENLSSEDIRNLSVNLEEMAEDFKATGKENIFKLLNQFNILLLK